MEGRYTIEERVGRGGMGIVYRAQDAKRGRTVAVKVLRPELVASLASARWVREIEIAQQLEHPNILEIYESGEVDGILYSVMPFIDGASLRDRLDRVVQLPVADALRIAYEVADALTYAHGRGIVHRDIKPGNVLLDEERVLVGDFGIARAMTIAGGDRITSSGVAVGTPGYMSPEQTTGDSAVDGRSDVYSLGCVLYEMLAGEPPFTGPTAQVIIARVLKERPPSVCMLRPEIPPAVEEVLGRALAKAPADRIGSSAELAEALERMSPDDSTFPGPEA